MNSAPSSQHGASQHDAAQHDVWQAPGALDLSGTLGIIKRGQGDPTVIFGSGAAWLAFNTAQGPATLRLRKVLSEVRATAWGPGAAQALAGVPSLTGLDDDWSAFDSPSFAASLPTAVLNARRRHPGLRLPATRRMVDSLVPAILEQKVTSLEALRAYAQLIRRHGSQAPGVADVAEIPQALKVAPTPAQWAKIPSWEWHKAGVGPQRSATIMRVLRSASGIERLANLPAPEAAQKLQTIPGIGVWTAAEVTQRTHADADQVSVGDYHLAAFVGFALTGQRTDDAGMLELLEPWRGHRQRVVRMLGLSGIRKPAFGPRMTIQDHRKH